MEMTAVRPTRLALAIGTAAVVTASGLAQSLPNFSGSWIVDVDKTAIAQGRSTGVATAGPPIMIAQDATTLVITRTNGQKTTYHLDGTEVANAVPPTGANRGANPIANLPSAGTDEVYKSAWQGSRLVTTMTGRGANGPTSAVETRWLEGDWMVTETTRKTTNGETTRRTHWKRASKLAFTKAA